MEESPILGGRACGLHVERGKGTGGKEKEFQAHPKMLRAQTGVVSNIIGIRQFSKGFLTKRLE